VSDGIISRIARKIRPGSGGPAKAISIVDGATGRAPSFRPSRIVTEDDGEDFDDAKSGMPLALSNQYGAGPKTDPIPSGILPGVDQDGNIPPYSSDDPGILARLFGFRGTYDGD
jgi:hypothetical protein